MNQAEDTAKLARKILEDFVKGDEGNSVMDLYSGDYSSKILGVREVAAIKLLLRERQDANQT